MRPNGYRCHIPAIKTALQTSCNAKIDSIHILQKSQYFPDLVEYKGGVNGKTPNKRLATSATS
jgi:hypothetical protein